MVNESYAVTPRDCTEPVTHKRPPTASDEYKLEKMLMNISIRVHRDNKKALEAELNDLRADVEKSLEMALAQKLELKE